MSLDVYDIIYHFGFRQGYRLAFISKAGYICFLPAVKRLGSVIRAVVGEFVSMLSYFLGTIAVFTWIAFELRRSVKSEVFAAT